MRKTRFFLFLSLFLVAISAFFPMIISAFDEQKTEFSITETTAFPGEEIDIDISIRNNPGILGATLSLTYDDSLTLVDAAQGEAFSCLSLTKPGHFSSPCRFVWDGQEISEKDINDGIVLSLKFAVSETATPGTMLPIALYYNNGDIVDGNLCSVDCIMNSGGITVNYTDGPQYAITSARLLD